MLRALDTFLLDNIFQKLADWFQEKTNKNCFFLARLCFWALLIVWTTRSVFLYLTSHISPDFITILFVICAVYVITRAEKREKDWDETTKNTANTDRVDDFLFRLFTIVIIGLNTLLVIVSAAGYFDLELLERFFKLVSVTILTSALYFMACTPKPPSSFRALAPIPVKSS